MKHDKPLWLKIKDWLECSDDEAVALAKRITISNTHYWAVADEDLKRQAQRLFAAGMAHWP